MRSLRIGTVAMALAALTLAAVPVSAERGERRNPNRGGGGGDTAQSRGGERRGPDMRQDSRPSDGGGYRAPRYEAPRSDSRGPDRGSRYEPRSGNRGPDQGRRYEPRSDNRGPDQGRRYEPRSDNRGPDQGRRYEAPRSGNRGPDQGRRYETPRYGSRDRGGRNDRGDNRYGNRGDDSRRYDNGRYAVPRVGPPPSRYDRLDRYDRRYDRRYDNRYRDDYRPRNHRYYGSYGYRPYSQLYWGHPYGYRPYGYRRGWSFNLYFGRPYGSYWSSNPYYGYYDIPAGFSYGSLRIVDAPRDAQVFVDGYYAGVVDDYDGVFQRLNLEPGPHRIEIVVPGYENEVFDVDILPGQTITYRSNFY